MKRTELIVDKQRMYALTKNTDGRLYLEVVTNGFAMENIVAGLIACFNTADR